MKTKVLSILLASLLLVNLFGCGGRHYATRDRVDHYMAPSLTQLPAKVTLVSFYLNREMVESEGIADGISWKAVMWNKSKEESQHLVINMKKVFPNKCMKVGLAVIPKSLRELEGNRIAIFNHSGSKVYDHQGEGRKLRQSKLSSLSGKIDPNDQRFNSFIPVITANNPFVREVTSDSKEFKDILSMYAAFGIADVKRRVDYTVQNYGSNLTEQQLKQIAREDSVVYGLYEWLGEGWWLYASFPFMGIRETAIIAGVAKVISLPSIWGDDLNVPGYSEYKTSAEDVAGIAIRIQEEYGFCLGRR